MTKNLQFVAGQTLQILRFAQKDKQLGFFNSPWRAKRLFWSKNGIAPENDQILGVLWSCFETVGDGQEL
jgi:hypothetical protein